MYVRVYRKDDQWFRKDTHALIGTEVLNTTSKYKFTQHIIQGADGTYYMPQLGYLDEKNKFVPLCKAHCCLSLCPHRNTPFCYHLNKINKTTGYYLPFKT